MLTTVRYVTSEAGELVAVPNNKALVKVQVWGMESRHKIHLSEFLELAKVGQCDAYIDGGSPGQLGVVQLLVEYSSLGGEVATSRVVAKIRDWVANYERNMRRRIICKFSDAADGIRVRKLKLEYQGVELEVVRGDHDEIVVGGDWDDKRQVVEWVVARIKK